MDGEADDEDDDSVGDDDDDEEAEAAGATAAAASAADEAAADALAADRGLTGRDGGSVRALAAGRAGALEAGVRGRSSRAGDVAPKVTALGRRTGVLAVALAPRGFVVVCRLGRARATESGEFEVAEGRADAGRSTSTTSGDTVVEVVEEGPRDQPPDSAPEPCEWDGWSPVDVTGAAWWSPARSRGACTGARSCRWLCTSPPASGPRAPATPRSAPSSSLDAANGCRVSECSSPAIRGASRGSLWNPTRGSEREEGREAELGPSASAGAVGDARARRRSTASSSLMIRALNALGGGAGASQGVVCAKGATFGSDVTVADDTSPALPTRAPRFCARSRVPEAAPTRRS